MRKIPFFKFPGYAAPYPQKTNRQAVTSHTYAVQPQIPLHLSIHLSPLTDHHSPPLRTTPSTQIYFLISQCFFSTPSTIIFHKLPVYLGKQIPDFSKLVCYISILHLPLILKTGQRTEVNFRRYSVSRSRVVEVHGGFTM